MEGFKPAKEEKVSGSEAESTRKKFRNIKRKFSQIKLIGLLAGTMFVAGETASAQSSRHEGTITSDSLSYVMTEKEKAEIKHLTDDVNGKLNILRTEISTYVPVTTEKESIESLDGKTVASFSETKVYEWHNMRIGAPGSFTTFGEGSVFDDGQTVSKDTTLPTGDNWIEVADTIDQVNGVDTDKDSVTTDSYFFEREPGANATGLSHYENKSGKPYHGIETTFDYGNSAPDVSSDNVISIEHDVEVSWGEDAGDLTPDAEKVTQDDFKQLKESLEVLEHKISDALKEAKKETKQSGSQ